jgi:transposase-like protein
MTPQPNHTQIDEEGQAQLQEMVKERLQMAIKLTLIQVLEEEIEAYIQAAPYQRTAERQDYRNGTYERDLDTSMGHIEDLPVPRTRKGYRTELFERYQRRQAELDEAICKMFVQGISQAQVGNVVEALSGIHPSTSTVSRVFHSLEADFDGWKKRELKSRYWYVFADGTYFKVIYDGEGCKMPILAVIGIDESGKRDVLGFTVGDCENQRAWEDLLDDLKDRGVETVDLWITDGHKAMLNAIQNKFPDAQRQRCMKHKMENILAYIPKKQQDQVRLELKAIFYQDNRQEADQVADKFIQKYAAIYPSAIACLKRDWEACLTFYSFPDEHWKFIRTNNVIERMFGEVKKRSKKMASAFRNENSCLLMFYAVIRSLKLRRISVPALDTGSLNLHNS